MYANIQLETKDEFIISWYMKRELGRHLANLILNYNTRFQDQTTDQRDLLLHYIDTAAAARNAANHKSS